MTALPHICVCVCTYRRVSFLSRLLADVARQETHGRFTFSLSIADNDTAASAEATVRDFAKASGLTVSYVVESRKNIALARNAALAGAKGDFCVFIDDDEFPVPEWLHQLYQTCVTFDCAGVLGPVRSSFEGNPPAWVKKCGLYDRLEHETGFVLSWHESRTGNVLFRRSILPRDEPPFDPKFATGGEDQDFFRRMMAKGHRFVWCNEAVVYETVPAIRWEKKIMVQRALLRGRNSLKHTTGFPWSIFKSAVAIPAYGCMLPLCAIAGTHYFMRYLVKLCDHLGRMLAAFGLNPMTERLG